MVLLILSLLGVCAGSFVEALTWRLHAQSRKTLPKHLARRDLSILKGRSLCPNCGHHLQAVDLIPLISWLTLRGKCRYCRKPISWQAPALELLAATLFISSYSWWPYGFTGTGLFRFSMWLVIMTMFLALSVYDLRWKLLPNRLVLPLFVLVALQQLILVFLGEGGLVMLRESILGLLSVGGIFYLLYWVSNERWIGGGDVKLGFVIGLQVGGPLKGFTVLFVASLLGLLGSLPLLLSGRAKRSSQIPFGPFLMLATVIVMLFGSALIAWYKRTFLLTGS